MTKGLHIKMWWVKGNAYVDDLRMVMLGCKKISLGTCEFETFETQGSCKSLFALSWILGLEM